MTFTEILDFTRRLTNTDSNLYTTTNLTADVNYVYDEIISLILSSDNRWQFDDKNFTTHPIATTDLVANQQDYEFDSTHLKVLKVLVKDQSGNWGLPLKEIDEMENSSYELLQNDTTNVGIPHRYSIYGSSLFLDPKPNYNVDEGIKVFFQRNGDEFLTSDTTKTPGFSSLFHKVLPIGAAYYFSVYRNLPQREALLRDFEKIKKDMVRYYQSRNKGDKPVLRVKYSNPQ